MLIPSCSGKHVFNSVPAEVLLRWDTVPSLVTSPGSQGLNGMVSRRTLPSESASSSRTQLVSIENTEELEAYPYYIPGERQAKFLAQLRIKSNAQQLKESLSFGHRSRSLDRFCSSSRGQRKRASLSPHVTNSKAKRQRRETSHSALRVTQKTNVLQKACKVSLKSFTVPLLRVKTKWFCMPAPSKVLFYFLYNYITLTYTFVSQQLSSSCPCFISYCY